MKVLSMKRRNDAYILPLFCLMRRGNNYILKVYKEPLNKDYIGFISEKEFNGIKADYSYFLNESASKENILYFEEDMMDDSYEHTVLQRLFKKEFKKYYIDEMKEACI